jgi:hypothetical protein
MKSHNQVASVATMSYSLDLCTIPPNMEKSTHYWLRLHLIYICFTFTAHYTHHVIF